MMEQAIQEHEMLLSHLVNDPQLVDQLREEVVALTSDREVQAAGDVLGLVKQLTRHKLGLHVV